MAQMLVSQLSSTLGNAHELVQMPFSQVKVREDGHVLEVNEANDLILDELAIKVLAKHLGVSAAYLDKCPGVLRAANLNYWIGQHKDRDAIFTLGGGQLVDVYSPDKKVIPIPQVGQIVSRVFRPEDEIITLHRDENRFHIDIKVDQHIEVPGFEGDEFRPQVGDITHGGVRIYIPADLNKLQPSVEPYLHRLVCSNGLSKQSDSSLIKLRGNTVPDILEEMEQKAQDILGNLPGTLGEYASLADVPINGEVLQVIRRLGQEHNIASRVLDRVMDAAQQIDRERPATMYDITQVFTEVANGSVAYGTSVALQRLGGHLLSHSSSAPHRCPTCAHQI